MTRWLRLGFALAIRAIRHPTIVPALLRISWRFRSNAWYKHFPFLPLPDPTYLRWRMYTAYGDYDAVPSVTDIERFARWATDNR